MHVRYDMPNEKKETRRERNERFGHPSPIINIPLGGEHLWNWYFDLSESVQRVRDGVCSPVPPTEFLAWAKLSNAIVRPREYDILRAMDRAFCNEMNVELSDYQARQEEEANRRRKK